MNWARVCFQEKTRKLHFYVKCRLMCYMKAIFKLKFHGIRIAFHSKLKIMDTALAHADAHAQHTNSLIFLHLIKWNGVALSLPLLVFSELLVFHALSHASYANSFRTMEMDGNYTQHSTVQYCGHKRCMQIYITQSKLRPIPFTFPLFHILFQQLKLFRAPFSSREPRGVSQLCSISGQLNWI